MTIYPSMAVRGTRCKVVYCPRSGLSAAALWRGKTWVKRLMKAADHLVAAWGRVAAEFPEWSVEIAGPTAAVGLRLVGGAYE